MTSTPKVSIVIPVYNGSNFLEEAINSALAQSYPNCEIIIINDGSDDLGKTRDIALSFGDKINYYEKENGGVATALNLGIKKMKGDYFSWLSHDDLFAPEKTDVQIKLAKKEKDKNFLICSRIAHIDKKGNYIATLNSEPKLIEEKPLCAVFKHYINGCSTLIPKEVFESVGYFDESLASTQDIDMWFRMARKIRFIAAPQVLTFSRQHQDQGYLNTSARREAEKTLVRLLKSLRPEEIVALEPTEELFFKKTACFFSDTEQYNVAEFAWSKTKKHHKTRYLIHPKTISKKILKKLKLLGFVKNIKRRFK